MVALPADHPLTREPSVALRGLADQEVVMFPRHQSPFAYDIVEETYRRAGLPLRVREEAEPTLSRLFLVAGGLGVSLVPETVPKYVRLPEVEWRLVDERLTFPVHAVWREDDRRQTVTCLVDLMAAEADQQFTARPEARVGRRRASSPSHRTPPRPPG